MNVNEDSCPIGAAPGEGATDRSKGRVVQQRVVTFENTLYRAGVEAPILLSPGDHTLKPIYYNLLPPGKLILDRYRIWSKV